MQRLSLIGLLAGLILGFACATSAAERPNILWITSEDNSPYLGCYGDELAFTPHLDKLAEQGVRYRNAFANAPVCSAARSTLITGMYASSTGVQNHRSRVKIPEAFRLYPDHLRAAGYYCTNNTKTDYNVAGRVNIWDDSSNKAHYRNRKAGQPFFAVFNSTISHESQVAPKAGKTEFRVAPEQMPLPPYHPDTVEIRRDWANYYDQMTAMDAAMGRLLEELEQENLADETIVFYYGDHGGALPRGKRNIHDSGTLVPLIVRIPDKWAAWRPAAPGDWVEDPVSFVDLPATVFQLCGIPIPEHYEGVPFLGPARPQPRSHVYLFRDRMDERYDTVRAVRDREYRYIRNYSPHRPWGQHYTYPFRVQPSMRSWYAEYAAGRCNPVQSRYWERKPGEEFYEIASDPHEIDNRIADDRLQEKIADLRAALHQEILTTRDTGFVPEGLAQRLAEGRTLYDYAQSAEYPLEQILELANLASDGRKSSLPVLMARLNDPHPIIRYWAATGCLILREESAPAKAALLQAVQDEAFDVRIVAAETLGYLGETEITFAVLAEAVQQGNAYEILAAQNSLDVLQAAGIIPLTQTQELLRPLKFSEPANRIPEYLLQLK